MVFVNQLTTWVVQFQFSVVISRLMGGVPMAPLTFLTAPQVSRKKEKASYHWLHMEKYDSLVYLALGGY